LPVVEILSTPTCHLCETAKALLHDLQATQAFILREIDISEHPALLRLYGEEIPVVFINGRKAFKYHVDATQCVRWLRRTRRRTAP
jgi:glutaredoxin